jgi:hypothetical protein
MDNKQFLYDNMEFLFEGITIKRKVEDMFENNTNSDRLKYFFDDLRKTIQKEKTGTQIGGSGIISLIALKKYINEKVDNIIPK